MRIYYDARRQTFMVICYQTVLVPASAHLISYNPTPSNKIDQTTFEQIYLIIEIIN